MGYFKVQQQSFVFGFVFLIIGKIIGSNGFPAEFDTQQKSNNRKFHNS
jgi:hypothetical protein